MAKGRCLRQQTQFAAFSTHLLNRRIEKVEYAIVSVRILTFSSTRDDSVVCCEKIDHN